MLRKEYRVEVFTIHVNYLSLLSVIQFNFFLL